MKKADTPPFLPHVEDDSPALPAHHLHGLVKLRAAVASEGTQDIAGETFGMHPDEDIFLSFHLAHD